MHVFNWRLYFLVSALNLVFHHFVGLWQGFVSFGFRSKAMALFNVGTMAPQSGSEGWDTCHTVVVWLFGEGWMRSERYQCVSTADLLGSCTGVRRWLHSPSVEGKIMYFLWVTFWTGWEYSTKSDPAENPKMVKLKLILKQVNVCWHQRNYWGKRFYILGRTWFQWFRWCLLFSPNSLCFRG